MAFQLHFKEIAQSDMPNRGEFGRILCVCRNYHLYPQFQANLLKIDDIPANNYNSGASKTSQPVQKTAPAGTLYWWWGGLAEEAEVVAGEFCAEVFVG